jgi:hypothetical protein
MTFAVFKVFNIDRRKFRARLFVLKIDPLFGSEEIADAVNDPAEFRRYEDVAGHHT